MNFIKVKNYFFSINCNTSFFKLLSQKKTLLQGLGRMKYPTITMSPVGYDHLLKRFENVVRFDNREIKIWTLELIIKITNTTMTVQFNPLNGLFILQGENGKLYTHELYSTTYMMYIDNTKYIATRVSWRDRPSSTEPTQSTTALRIDSLLLHIWRPLARQWW